MAKETHQNADPCALPRHKYHSLGMPSDTHKTGACALDRFRVQSVPKWKESGHLRPLKRTCLPFRRRRVDACSLLACQGHLHFCLSSQLASKRNNGKQDVYGLCLPLPALVPWSVSVSGRQNAHQSRTQFTRPMLKPPRDTHSRRSKKHQCPFDKQQNVIVYLKRVFGSALKGTTKNALEK